MDTNENHEQANQYKRKRKKSFLKNARKYAKKGHYGRGSQLDGDTYQYFVRIMEAYREGFSSDEDKLIFVSNVFVQMEDQEVNVSCNQVGCRAIEILLPFASDSVFENFMKAFGSDNMRPLCGDQYASHVIEKLVEVSCQRSSDEKTEADFKPKYKEFALKVSKFLLNNLEDYVWDTYGNHIIRTVLKSLSTELSDKELAGEYFAIVKEYAMRLIMWPQFKDMPYSELTSGLLQVLLVALKVVSKKQLTDYVKKLLDESFVVSEDTEGGGDRLNDVFSSKPAMMLLETALQVSKYKSYMQIYTKCFINKLAVLAKNRSTNFAVQKLITYCSEKVDFEAMFDELADHFGEILKVGHSGLILALGQACKRLSAKQGNFVQNIMMALGCSREEAKQSKIVLCLSKLTILEELQSISDHLEKEKLNLHGTIIVQTILEFNKPIKIVNSILSLDTNVLKGLLCNSMGSHITDSYVKSQFVGEKSREKLVRKLQGTYQDMAMSKYGSRSFEALWNATNHKCKLGILDELSYKDGLWSNTEYGRIIAGKVNLVLYNRNKEEWKSWLNKTCKDKVTNSSNAKE